MSGSHFVFDTLLRLSEFITIHCMAALDPGAGVEQPIDCLIIQNRQADTFEDNIVDSLFFCATQATEGVISHLCKQERKRSTLVQRRLNRAIAVLGRAIPRGCVPMSRMEVRSLVALSNHSAFHRWSAQGAALLLSSYELMRCCSAGTNGCLDLRCRAFPLGGQVSAEWSQGRIQPVRLRRGRFQ